MLKMQAGTLRCCEARTTAAVFERLVCCSAGLPQPSPIHACGRRSVFPCDACRSRMESKTLAGWLFGCGFQNSSVSPSPVYHANMYTMRICIPYEFSSYDQSSRVVINLESIRNSTLAGRASRTTKAGGRQEALALGPITASRAAMAACTLAWRSSVLARDSAYARQGSAAAGVERYRLNPAPATAPPFASTCAARGERGGLRPPADELMYLQ